MSSKQRIAFLGLGVMGGGMARRLAAAGFPLAVWNRTASGAEPLRDLGVTVASTPADAAADADIVVSMVADDAASWSVWAGSGGALERIPRGAIVVECSTVSPTWVAELTALAAAKGCAAIDAPVTGSRTQAASGELQFLVGGDAAVLEQVRPALAVMSRNIVHVGPAGSGARLKLINNYLCGVQAAALAEAVVLIEQSNLSLEASLGVLQNGAPGSPLVKAVSHRMASRDYAVNFKLGLMTKDLSYAIAEGQRHGVDLETARAALGRFQLASQTPWNDQDFAAVVEVLRP